MLSDQMIFFTGPQNTDTGLLMAVSFPCFATHDDYLYKRTKDKIIRKLHRSNYGIKRFLRDGYGTVLEDRSRKYYTSGETKVSLSSASSSVFVVFIDPNWMTSEKAEFNFFFFNCLVFLLF